MADEEILRYFVTSVDIDLKKSKRRFKAKSLARAYSKGLSVCRINHATTDEIIITAGMLFDIQVEIKGGYGGIIAVLDFPAHAVRKCPDDVVPMCVYETPYEVSEVGRYTRPSHADIVSSQPDMSEEDRLTNQTILFNQIHKLGTLRNIEDAAEPYLAPYLPAVLRRA